MAVVAGDALVGDADGRRRRSRGAVNGVAARQTIADWAAWGAGDQRSLIWSKSLMQSPIELSLTGRPVQEINDLTLWCRVRQVSLTPHAMPPPVEPSPSVESSPMKSAASMPGRQAYLPNIASSHHHRLSRPR